MLIGVIADDFTGASDIANTLAKGVLPEGGLRTAQFTGVPEQDALPGIEAGVISLKTRSIPSAEAIEQSLAALAWLQSQGCTQIVFKYCSTFDSTPDGNIGPVGEALAEALGAKAVVVCPAFPRTGRTVFQGHLFVFDALLNESGMQHHPITPMTDPNLRRCLADQSSGSVGLVALPMVQAGGDVLRKDLDRCAAQGNAFSIVDAVSDDDLLRIADVVHDDALVTGGSGIAMGLPRNFHRRGLASTSRMQIEVIKGPGVVLAGSCSGATLSQIESHAAQYASFAIDVEQVMTGAMKVENLVDFITQHRDSMPLVYSSSKPVSVKAMQEKFGGETVSSALENLFAACACELLRAGYTRLIVAGGETSSAVAQSVSAHLSAQAMRVGPEIDPGVPVLYLGRENPIAMALKSGNFGSEDFFAKALTLMAEGNAS